ncbi:MAG TPA: DUF4037 domain-containing protein [Streptosporangiaceae bacterium]|nr:DUF4037 domain-containing protein [Streptosporangiaceae bacterium]
MDAEDAPNAAGAPGAPFVPGIELARRYYAEVVRPLLDRHQAGLAHSAALIGWGSDALGYDSARSTDHNWGPRCLIFVGPGDANRINEIGSMLEAELPPTFLGWPTRFPDVTRAEEPVRHWVDVAELGGWLTGQLGFDPRAGVDLADWLATPTQQLAELTGGAVFHDGLDGQSRGLDAARQALRWYPDDIWRYVLACQWQRISQEEAFPGRCAEAEDELGSAIITARLARDSIRLVMLMRRSYPPYSKWLGTAAARLEGASGVVRLCYQAITATAWPDRERALSACWEELGRVHNELGLTEPIDATVRPFYDRPYQIIDAGRFAAALIESIADDQVRRLPLTGAVDQFIDSTDAAGDRRLRRAAVQALITR